jgi:hypothetical protein
MARLNSEPIHRAASMWIKVDPLAMTETDVFPG